MPLYIHTEIGMHPSRLLVCLVVLTITSAFVTSAQTQNTSQRTPNSITQASEPQASSARADTRKAEAEAKRYYKLGVKYGRANLLKQAADLFNRAVILKPDYKEAYYDLGSTYLLLKRWKEAIDAFEQVTKIDPQDLEAYSKLAEARAGLWMRAKAPSRDREPVAVTKLAKELAPVLPPKTVAVKTKPEEAFKTTSEKVTASVSKPLSADPVLRSKSTGEQPTSNASAPAAYGSSNSRAELSDVKLPTGNSPATEFNPAMKTVAADPKATTTALQPPAPDKSPGEKVAENRASPASNGVSGGKSILDATSALGSDNSNVGGTAPNDLFWSVLKPSIGESLIVRASQRQKANNSGGEKPVPETPTSAAATPNKSVTQPDSKELDPTRIYRIGVGDILDVKLSGATGDESSLFTVSPNGLLEHPILAQPLKVAGLTTEEVAQKVALDLKSRAVNENPEVFIGVREYVSHTIIISGLVKEPGTKILRREAIPLYVVLADAQPMPEAGRVTIVPLEGQTTIVDLSDPKGMNLLVRPGDVITVRDRPEEFFYVGGEVKNPGEKPFRPGIRLTQAILVAGGLTRKSKEAQLARESGDGRLVVKRYKLKEINNGKVADPFIEPGDRITVVR